MDVVVVDVVVVDVVVFESLLSSLSFLLEVLSSVFLSSLLSVVLEPLLSSLPFSLEVLSGQSFVDFEAFALSLLALPVERTCFIPEPFPLIVMSPLTYK